MKQYFFNNNRKIRGEIKKFKNIPIFFTERKNNKKK